MEYEVKKLWKGHLVSLRDYTVNKGIKEGRITDKFNNESLFLSPETLKHGSEQTKEIKSKFQDGQTYNLVDYRWNPDVETQEELPF